MPNDIKRIRFIQDKSGNYYEIISSGFGGKNPILRPVLFSLDIEKQAVTKTITEEQFKNDYLNVHAIYFDLIEEERKARIVK